MTGHANDFHPGSGLGIQCPMTPVFYHASKLLRLVKGSWFRFCQWLRDARHRAVSWLTDPVLAWHLALHRKHVRRRDWHAVLKTTQEIVPLVEARRDAKLMEAMGKSLELLGEYGGAARLRMESRRIRKGSRPNEWNGEDISHRTLLVNLRETTKQGMSTAIRAAGLVGQAARRAKRCIVIVEPRLVPLFRRTFPGVDVRAAGAGDDAVRVEADVVAGLHHLRAVLVTDAKAIAACFVPLRPDSELSRQFRTTYRSSDRRPVIGISWASTAHTKEIPGLGDWAQFLQKIDATFVSLQYGKIDGDLAKLRMGDRNRIIYDRSVDQLVDMDRFSAQVASLDAVVSISNTGAHLAGALAVPGVLIFDDKFRRGWPVIGDTTPWCPRMKLVMKKGRPWNEVMEEVRERLDALLTQPARDVAQSAIR